MHSDMNGKVVLITGGTGGLGTGVSKAFTDTGAKIVVTYIHDKEAEEFKQAISSNYSLEKVDLFSAVAVATLFDRVKQSHGRLDALVCLAGGFAGGKPIAEAEEAEWDKLFALNTKSAYYCIKYAIPLLQQAQGSIVTVGSTMGLKGSGNFGAYGASKAALINLTQSVADEGKKTGVRANIVIPSIIDTAANRASMPKADFSKWVTPDSLAQVILFLASDASKDVSGASVPVYGGAA